MTVSFQTLEKKDSKEPQQAGQKIELTKAWTLFGKSPVSSCQSFYSRAGHAERYAVKILLSILFLCLIGCSSSQQHVVQQEPDPEAEWPERFKSSNISFDILAGGYTVQILVNGKGIYDQKPIIDTFNGIPDTITIKKPRDVIDVDVVMGKEYYSSTFDLKEGRYFIINYFRDEIVVFQEKDAPWYD